MTTPISAAAKAAQSAARRRNGEFGEQPRDETPVGAGGVDLVTDGAAAPDAALWADARAEVAALRERLAAIEKVYDYYFDRDTKVGDYDATPEPEDVWRFDRDMRAVLDAPLRETSGCCGECAGQGTSGQGTCWDCRGTGHPHTNDKACVPDAAPRVSLQTDAPLPSLSLRTHDGPAKGLAQMVDDGELDLTPPYQRGSVWSQTQRQQLIRSMLMNLPIPPVTLNDRWASDFRDADGQTLRDKALGGAHLATYGVIDGKQRIETVHAWTHDGFGVPASWFEPDSIGSTYETDDGPYVRWSNLSQTGQTRFSTSVKIPRTTATVKSVQEEAELYLLLNGEGVAQTDADMANAARVANEESR